MDLVDVCAVCGAIEGQAQDLVANFIGAAMSIVVGVGVVAGMTAGAAERLGGEVLDRAAATARGATRVGTTAAGVASDVRDAAVGLGGQVESVGRTAARGTVRTANRAADAFWWGFEGRPAGPPPSGGGASAPDPD